MLPQGAHTKIERDFRSVAKVLFADIALVGRRLARHEHRIKQATIGLIAEEQENGEHYKMNILAYLKGLDEKKNNYSRRIETLGTRITASILLAKKDVPKRQAKKYRRDIWLALTSALEPLSGRPSKKVAAILIDDQNRLVIWDGNHLCHGIERFSALYLKGIDGGRGHHIWCAERNVIAKYLGIGAAMPAEQNIEAVHESIGRFTQSLIGAAIHHPDLRKLTLVSGHYPCVPCAEVIAPHDEHQHKKGRIRTVKEVIAYWNEATEGALKNPARKTQQAPAILRKAKVSENLKKLRNCDCP